MRSRRAPVRARCVAVLAATAFAVVGPAAALVERPATHSEFTAIYHLLAPSEGNPARPPRLGEGQHPRPVRAGLPHRPRTDQRDRPARLRTAMAESRCDLRRGAALRPRSPARNTSLNSPARRTATFALHVTTKWGGGARVNGIQCRWSSIPRISSGPLILFGLSVDWDAPCRR